MRCLVEYPQVNSYQRFAVYNWLHRGVSIFQLLFNFPIEYAIREDQDNQKRLKLNGLNQILVCADDSNLTVKNIITYQRKKYMQRNSLQ